jgi:serine/threonine-protein kinase
MGTPTYMAPEQCRGVAVDHRVDLYALGCIMFELVAGRPPFVGEGSGDVLAAHIHVPVPALATLGVELPRPIEDVIQSLLVKAPAQRTPSAEALIQAIDGVSVERARTTTGQIAEGRRARTAPASPNDITTLSGAANSKTGMPSASSRRRLIALIGGAAVAGVVGVVIATSGHTGEPARVPYNELHGEPGKPEVAAAAAGKPAAPGVTAAAPAAPDVTAAAPAAPGVTAAAPAAPDVTPPVAVAATEPAASAAAAAVAAPAVTPVASAPTPAPVAQPAPTPAPVAPTPAPATPATPAKAEPLWLPVATPAEQAIDIETTPSGAQVSLGGQSLGKTPLHTSVQRASDASVVIHLSGFADRTLTFHTGKPLKDTANLVKLPPPRPKQNAAPNRDKSVNPFGND